MVRATVDPSNLSPQGLYIMVKDFKRLVRILLKRHKWHKNHIPFPQTIHCHRVCISPAWAWGGF